uniref:PAZ domain-containing protein n=1 Tax=Rhabditophanes sp. KR3021 TaxID=114890 RepID=A0AC35U9P7_9BILA
MSGDYDAPKVFYNSSTKEDMNQIKFLRDNQIPVGNGKFASKGIAGSVGKKVTSVTNFFPLTPTGDMKDYKYYQYDMDIWGVRLDRSAVLINKRIADEIMVKKKPDYYRVKKHSMFLNLWIIAEKELVKLDTVDPNTAVYDFDRTVFTRQLFRNMEQISDLVFGIKNVALADYPQYEMAGLTHLEFHFKLVKNGNVFGMLGSDQLENKEGQQYLELLAKISIHKRPQDMAIYENGKTYLMNPESAGFGTKDMPELPDGKYLGVGFQQTIRPYELEPGNGGVAIVMDEKKTAFHGCQFLHHKYELLLTGSRGMLPFSGANAVKVLNNFKGLVCHVTHRQEQAITISGVIKENAFQKFFLMEGVKISVAEYIKTKYGRELQFPEYPLVEYKCKGSDGKLQLNFIPMELCYVADFQRVVQGAQTAEQISTMIRACATAPSKRMKEIENIYNNCDYVNDEYLINSGFESAFKMLEIPSRKLPIPQLNYKKGIIKPSTDLSTWDHPRGDTFIKPSAITNWAGYYFESKNRFQMEMKDMKDFISTFRRICLSRGMSVSECFEIKPVEATPYGVENLFSYLKESGTDFVMFFSPPSVTNVHGPIKYMELVTGIVTQDIKMDNALKILEKNQIKTLENIILKTNVKMGGLNYSINLKLENNMPVLDNKRLILGLAFNNTNSSLCDTFTTIGYSSNCIGSACEFAGDYVNCNLARDGDVAFWVTILNQTLDIYVTKNNGFLPKEVVIYRSSGSEGRYISYSKYDCAVIESVLKKFDPTIKFTLIVVEKNHNIRLFRKGINSCDRANHQNISPGTVVDTKIVNPKLFEFYLTSHSGLQGTCKVPRYIVIRNDLDLSSDELQVLTNTLAYGYQIVNSPVSLPAPMYIAEQYADRGRALINAYKDVSGMELYDDQLTTLHFYNQEHDLKYQR